MERRLEPNQPAMSYTIQCTDITTGQTGCFGFDVVEYLGANKPLQFKAKTPIFPHLGALLDWARSEGIELVHRPVQWGAA